MYGNSVRCTNVHVYTHVNVVHDLLLTMKALTCTAKKDKLNAD